MKDAMNLPVSFKFRCNHFNRLVVAAVACWLITQSESVAFQSQPTVTRPTRISNAPSPIARTPIAQWQDKTEEVKIGQADLIQTYRLHRNRQEKRKGEPIIQSRVKVNANGESEIQIESIGQKLSTPGMNAIQVFSNELPHQHGVFGGQIIVELQKDKRDKNARSIGFFAPNSWIESKNGRVELVADSIEFAGADRTAYWIGVMCREQSSSQDKTTLVVDEVVEDSAAKQAGVRVRDRIVRWNQKKLTTVESLVQTIQSNKDKSAKLGIVRDGNSVELDIKPKARKLARSLVQTVIVPAAQVNVAQKKIEQLRKLVEVSNVSENRQFRVLLVGPGVNFGNEEIELQVDPEIHATKAQLKQMLDRVAEKKFGLFVEEDSITLKKAAEEKESADKFEFKYDLSFEPHEIWETIQFGVKDKKFSFEQLAPRIIHRTTNGKLLTVEKQVKEAQSLAKRLKGGQIVFPNPLSIVRQEELKAKIDLLKQENERIRAINADLKAALQELKEDLEKETPDDDR